MTYLSEQEKIKIASNMVDIRVNRIIQDLERVKFTHSNMQVTGEEFVDEVRKRISKIILTVVIDTI